MSRIDIAVIVCVSVFTAAVVAYLIYCKVKNKGKGCCGDCAECGKKGCRK